MLGSLCWQKKGPPALRQGGCLKQGILFRTGELAGSCRGGHIVNQPANIKLTTAVNRLHPEIDENTSSLIFQK